MSNKQFIAIYQIDNINMRSKYDCGIKRETLVVQCEVKIT